MKIEKDIFLKGHTIGLRVPTEDDMLKSGWHTWYNDYETTRYNSHGVYPVSVEDEYKFIQETLNKNDAILLAIYDLKNNKLLGNACLQNINHFNRRCNLSVTIGEPASMSACIEVFGLLTEHAFMKLNLERIEEGTHEALLKLVKMLSVIGYEIEGVSKRYFLKDNVWSSKINYSVLKDDFLKLRSERDNKILFSDYNDLKRAIINSLK